MFKKKYIMYCPVCGYVDYKHETNTCQYCGHVLKDSDHPLKEAKDKGGYRSLLTHVEEDIVERFVKTNAEFQEKVYIQRLRESDEQLRLADERVQKKWDAQKAEYEKILAERAANAPRCPTCGSTDLKKIDALDRAISVSFLGLASGKIGKSFKCNHCGYMW